jgi:hypothetical protein
MLVVHLSLSIPNSFCANCSNLRDEQQDAHEACKAQPFSGASFRPFTTKQTESVFLRQLAPQHLCEAKQFGA